MRKLFWMVYHGLMRYSAWFNKHLSQIYALSTACLVMVTFTFLCTIVDVNKNENAILLCFLMLVMSLIAWIDISVRMFKKKTNQLKNR